MKTSVEKLDGSLLTTSSNDLFDIIFSLGTRSRLAKVILNKYFCLKSVAGAEVPNYSPGSVFESLIFWQASNI